MIDVKRIENEIMGKEEEASNHSMAYLLLAEVKASAKRWFVIALIELIILLSVIAGVLWYASLPVEEGATTVTQETEDSDNNTFVGVGDNNVNKADGDYTKETQGEGK